MPPAGALDCGGAALLGQEMGIWVGSRGGARVCATPRPSDLAGPAGGALCDRPEIVTRRDQGAARASPAGRRRAVHEIRVSGANVAETEQYFRMESSIARST